VILDALTDDKELDGFNLGGLIMKNFQAKN